MTRRGRWADVGAPLVDVKCLIIAHVYVGRSLRNKSFLFLRVFVAFADVSEQFILTQAQHVWHIGVKIVET